MENTVYSMEISKSLTTLLLNPTDRVRFLRLLIKKYILCKNFSIQNLMNKNNLRNFSEDYS